MKIREGCQSADMLTENRTILVLIKTDLLQASQKVSNTVEMRYFFNSFKQRLTNLKHQKRKSGLRMSPTPAPYDKSPALERLMGQKTLQVKAALYKLSLLFLYFLAGPHKTKKTT